jgi:hypothetical protein
MFRLEEIGLLAFEVKDSDEAVLDDERNCEFGANVGIGRDIAFNLGDIVNEHGLAREGDLSDHAFAEREAHALRFRRVADLKAHTELVGTVVDEKDGEDAVGDDGTDELGSAIKQSLEVERGIESVGDLGEIAKVGGFNSSIFRIDVGVGVFSVDRAVIALILGFGAGVRWSRGHGGLKSMIQEQGLRNRE